MHADSQRLLRKRFREEMAAARAYESKCQRIRDESGYRAARDRLTAAIVAVVNHAFDTLSSTAPCL